MHLHVRALVMALLLLAAACAGPGPSGLPASTTPPLTASPASSLPAPTGTATVAPSIEPSIGPTLAPFDPAAVSVAFERYAMVPGSPLAIAAPDDRSGRLFEINIAGL